MEIIIGAQTDRGLKREVNEDAYGIFDDQNLFMVADGMGGHAGGRIASQLAIETIGDFIQAPSEANYSLIQIQNLLLLSEDLYQFERVKVTDLVLGKDLPEKALDLVKAVRLANRRIYNTAVAQPKLAGMGTTIVAVTFEANLVYICHVGDSRVYRLRAEKLEQLTEDHSWVNELLEDKEITEEEAANFKYKNVLTRALGITENVKVDLRIEEVEAGDLFLLCSDGLCGQISDKQISEILNRAEDSLGPACRELIKAANDTGGPDNITVVSFKVSQVEKEESLPNPIVQVIGKEDEQVLIEEDKVLKRVYGKEKVKISPETKRAPKPKAKQIKPVKTGLYLAAAAVILFLLGGGIYFFTREGPVPSKLPVEEKSSVTTPLAEGLVTLITVPSQANIFLDGSGLEELTPLTKYKLEPGKHTVKFAKFGYRTSPAQEFSVLAGIEKRIEEKLIAEAVINLIFLPKIGREAVGAKIIIDGYDLGTLKPYHPAIPVPKGTHTLTLKKQGFFKKIEFTLYESEQDILIK
ncbi:MAG: Stp1/IreP family PP2C-type Ser/Thr phosphatase [bacterium]